MQQSGHFVLIWVFKKPKYDLSWFTVYAETKLVDSAHSNRFVNGCIHTNCGVKRAAGG
jgi:hypothetical protein